VEFNIIVLFLQVKWRKLRT